jgi:hypothetical protein
MHPDPQDRADRHAEILAALIVAAIVAGALESAAWGAVAACALLGAIHVLRAAPDRPDDHEEG